MCGNVVYTTLGIISDFEEHFFHKIEQVMRNLVLVNENTDIESIRSPKYQVRMLIDIS